MSERVTAEPAARPAPRSAQHGWLSTLPGWLWLLLAAIVAVAAVPFAFGGLSLRPLGTDMFAYVWQTRLVDHAPMADLGSRPGVPTAAALLSDLHVLSRVTAPLLLGNVFLAALALASAAFVRMALRLPHRSLGMIAVVVALWGGDIRLTTGYLANLLGLVLVVVGIGLLVVARRDGRSGLPEGIVALSVSGVAHLGFLPLYMAVAGLWLVWTVARRVAGRRSADPELRSAIRLMLGMLVAGAVAAVLILGVLGFTPSEIVDTAGVSLFFRSRLVERLEWVGPLVSVVLFGLGVLALRSRPRTESGSSLIGVGVMWLTVGLGGVLATLIVPTVPGHRILTVTLPIPVMMGIGVAGTFSAVSSRSARLLGRGQAGRVAGAGVAGLVLVGAMAWVAAPGLGAIAQRAVNGRDRGEETGRLIGGWAEAAHVSGPLVIETHPLGAPGARMWKGRVNVMRAYVPVSLIPSTYVAIAFANGDVIDPSTTAGEAAAERLGESVQLSWTHVAGPLSSGAVIVVPREFFSGPGWLPLSKRVWRAADQLLVIRGPKVKGEANDISVAIEPAEAVVRGIAVLLVAIAAGGGYALGWARARGGTVLDGIGLAPAAGLMVFVLAGVVAGLAGAGGAGRVGLGLALAAAGWVSWPLGRRAELPAG